jgi:hypothetical protein
MAEKVPNPKFQIPDNPQFSNPNRAEASAVVRYRLLALEVSPFGLPWSLGFGIWSFLILN